jgi:alpha-galactosidase
MAYFGDHVDMVKDDLASTVGIGGVVGTNFRWPVGAASSREGKDLTPEREQLFSKWLGIYKDKMLSRGEYLGNLYDIGFDKPETHAIRKGGNIYYAFYAPQWNGKVTLRGLEARGYRVTDYVDGKDLGTVRGPVPTLNIGFEKHLLIEAKPQ